MDFSEGLGQIDLANGEDDLLSWQTRRPFSLTSRTRCRRETKIQSKIRITRGVIIGWSNVSFNLCNASTLAYLIAEYINLATSTLLRFCATTSDEPITCHLNAQ